LLAYLPLLLLAVLAWRLIQIQAYKPFPWFFLYVVYAIAAGAGRFFVRNHAIFYFRTYWVTETGYLIISTIVLYEVFRRMGLARSRIWWLRFMFPMLVLLSAGLTTMHWYSSPSQVTDPRIAFIITLELGVQLLQGLVFVVLMILVPTVGLGWKQHALGIAGGFGVNATIMFLTTTKFSAFGTGFDFLWRWSAVVAYSIAVSIWLWFFATPDHPAKNAPIGRPITPEDLEEMQRYKEIIRRKPR